MKLAGILLFAVIISGCATELRDVRPNENPQSDSIIYGLLYERVDVTGVPLVFFIPIKEYELTFTEKTSKKEFVIHITGGDTNKFMVKYMPAGEYELSYINVNESKFPLINNSNGTIPLKGFITNDPNMNSYVYGNNAPNRPGFSMSVGVSRTTLDYSKMTYPKYSLSIKPNTINYIGNLEYHLFDWSDDFNKVDYIIKIHNDKIKADELASNYINIKKAEINILK